MYQRNPHDHARDRQDGGEQPFADAKEALSESDAELERTASPEQTRDETESDQQRTARQESETAERLERIGHDVEQSREHD